MKKIVTGYLVLLYCLNCYSQGGEKYRGDRYNDFIDSMLITIGQLITNDLSKDSIFVVGRLWRLGDAFVFEVVFDSKSTFILNMLGSNAMIKKTFKQRGPFNLRRWKFDAFRNYIDEHQALPYDSFDHFKYRFLLLAKNEKLLGEAVYGEYKFKATDKDISIMDRKIEILQDENSIRQKYNSNF